MQSRSRTTVGVPSPPRPPRSVRYEGKSLFFKNGTKAVWLNVSSPQECCQVCGEFPECGGYTWEPLAGDGWNNTCELKVRAQAGGRTGGRPDGRAGMQASVPAGVAVGPHAEPSVPNVSAVGWPRRPGHATCQLRHPRCRAACFEAAQRGAWAAMRLAPDAATPYVLPRGLQSFGWERVPWEPNTPDCHLTDPPTCRGMPISGVAYDADSDVPRVEMGDLSTRSISAARKSYAGRAAVWLLAAAAAAGALLLS